jgi:3-isopropylmalate dehydrogenase
MEGDGIGPEITAATMNVLAAADRAFGLALSFTPISIGLAALRAEGKTLSERALEAAKSADGVILGPVSHNEYPPVSQGGLNPSGELRKRLDLFANIRPARSRGGFPARCGSPVDLVIVRENTEGFYADRSMFVGSGEFMPTPDLALSVRKITRAGSTRIAEAAFALALRRRRKVTAVHKANVLRVSGRAVSRQRALGGIALSRSGLRGAHHRCHGGAARARRRRLRRGGHHQHVRRYSLRSCRRDFRQSRACGLAQCRHRPRAGPGAARLRAGYCGPGSMLLAGLGERRGDEQLIRAAAAIDDAVESAIADPLSRTADLGGPLGTKAFGERVSAQLRGLSARS